MAQYMTNAVNTSPTRAGEAAAAMTDIGGKAVKFDTDGKIVLCDTAGEMPMGIVTIDNDTEVKASDSVTYQIFGVGVAVMSEAVTAGTELTVTASGTLAAAASGNFVCAVALADCNANAIGTVKVVNYYKS